MPSASFQIGLNGGEVRGVDLWDFSRTKRSQFFLPMHNETPSVAAMCVGNPGRSPVSMISLSKCPCFGTILVMNTFNLFPPNKETERPQTNQPDSSFVPGPSDRALVPTQSGALLSRGVSIKGSVKFRSGLCIDGEVEGTIDSHGTLMIGEHARIRGEIRAKSVNVLGKVEGNIFVTERCELQAGSTVQGDIEAPRLTVDENATFSGSAKVGTGKSLQPDVRLPS
jgi:cytoskeletal protein CcmA (bactofilin family)